MGALENQAAGFEIEIQTYVKVSAVGHQGQPHIVTVTEQRQVLQV